MIKISPSILAADFSKLGGEVAAVAAGGADYLHIDVMDGHFVPNLSFGIPVLRSLRPLTGLPFDVHLMIDNPDDLLDAFLEAGADIVTFHLEAARDPEALIGRIARAGASPSIAIRPATPAKELFPFLDRLGMALIMTVEPGFGGQKMIPECLEKAAALRREAEDRGLKLDIEADGGITEETAGDVYKSGVNVFVAGSAVFKAPDAGKAIRRLRKAAEGFSGNNA